MTENIENDTKLYELACRVFNAFNEFLAERNLLLSIDNPLTFISDEDGQTLIYTRGEYATEVIDNICKLHKKDPLRHTPFKTAIQIASNKDLLDEITRRLSLIYLEGPPE